MRRRAECGGGYYDDLTGYNDTEKEFMRTFEIGVYTGQHTNNLQYNYRYKNIPNTRITELKNIVFQHLKNIGAFPK